MNVFSPEEVQSLVASLSPQDKERVLYNVLWDLFGDIDEDERETINFDYRPDEHDLKMAIYSLRQEFRPDGEAD